MTNYHTSKEYILRQRRRHERWIRVGSELESHEVRRHAGRIQEANVAHRPRVAFRRPWREFEALQYNNRKVLVNESTSSNPPLLFW